MAIDLFDALIVFVKNVLDLLLLFLILDKSGDSGALPIPLEALPG